MGRKGRKGTKGVIPFGPGSTGDALRLRQSRSGGMVALATYGFCARAWISLISPGPPASASLWMILPRVP